MHLYIVYMERDGMPVLVAAVIDREEIVSSSKIDGESGGFVSDRERGRVINQFNLGFLSDYR